MSPADPLVPLTYHTAIQQQTLHTDPVRVDNEYCTLLCMWEHAFDVKLNP